MTDFRVLKKPIFFLSIILILLVPTFWRMLQPGIFSMQDFHIFRLFEFEKCVLDLQIPCRWSPDAAFEYGEPLFNFYGQLPYFFGEFFRLVGFSFIDSLKGLFIASIVVSAFGMFLLARQLWKDDFAALLSALVYTYAPYRALDIYVRGALPEALAFAFFPFLTYFFNKFVLGRKNLDLLLFGVLFAALILTHNLSALMYSVFLLFWGVYLLFKEKAFCLLPRLFGAAALAFGLSAFYILPLLGESNLISLHKTTEGYFNFRSHFATLNQLLISRDWGYGASVWGEDDGLSLSVGQIQWILPLIAGVLIAFKKSFKSFVPFFVLVAVGWFMLWLTHNKSAFLWEAIPFMPYIQFPWRFLSLAVFSFAISSGVLLTYLKGTIKLFVAATIGVLLIALNSGFFFEDLWFSITDREQFSGFRYEQLVSASLIDYWPEYGNSMPVKFAPKDPVVVSGEGSGRLLEKRSNSASFDVSASPPSEVQFPIVYFPGWVALQEDKHLNVYPSGDLGLITTKVGQGQWRVFLKFENTQIRTVGNLISLGTLLGVLPIIFWLRLKRI